MRKIPYYVILSTETIKNYIVMAESTNSGKIIIFAAPSGAGKSTLLNLMSKELNHLCLPTVSDNTRKKRKNEIDGQHYNFLDSVDIFKKNIELGKYLEWEEVYPGKFYGTPKTELTRIWKLGKTPLLDIDIQGAMVLKNHLGENAFIVGIDVPGRDISERIEVLRLRLLERDEPIEEVNKRLKKAETEFELMLETQRNIFNLLVMNDVIHEGEKQVKNAILEFLYVSA